LLHQVDESLLFCSQRRRFGPTRNQRAKQSEED